MMRMLQRLVPDHALPLLIFLAAAGWQLYMQSPFIDPDTGWHIMAGKLTLAHGKPPLHDPWSYTAGDVPWYNLAWGFDVLLYGLHALGGLPLLYFLTVVAYGAMAMLLARDALRRGAGPIAVIGFFILVAGPMIMQSALCRPQIVSIFLFYFSVRIFERDRNEPSLRRLMWLPPMMVIWVNAHGGFILLGILFAVHLADALAVDDRVRIRRLLVAGIFTALAILVNPYGWHIYDALTRALDSVMTYNIMEWRGVDFSAMWWFDMAILACIFGLRPTEKNIPFSEKSLVLATFLLSLHAARHGIMFAIASTAFLTANLTQVLYALGNGGHHRAQDKLFERWLTDKRVRQAALACAIMLAVLAAVPTGRALIAPHADEFAKGKTPVKALHFIREHYPDAMRWFNEYGLGGSLIYYSKGRFPVFIDGRAGNVYSEPFLKEYLRVMETYVYGTKARAILRKYDADGLIMPTMHRVNAHLKNNPLWKRVYKDKTVTLYVRKLKTD